MEATYRYETASDEFMTAFAAENYDTSEGISDPRYVRWITNYVERKGDEWINSYYPMYKCQEEDFAQF